ncbi:MAG: phosphoglycerate kinase [Bacteroidales bacterium]|jgi:phosphoglycerate kinase|nr:phosphoglycerate kinase [Bacteroidales bacterium]
MCAKANIETYDFSGKKVLIRVDYNVPLNEEFQIQDTKRIDASLPTLRKVLDDGGSVILLSHLGRPKNKEYTFSLKHLVPYLGNILGDTNVYFAPECIGDQAKSYAESLKPGEVLLLENVRFYPEEEDADMDFAKELASYGDAYIHEAFSTAHRYHATTAVLPRLFPNDKMYGYLMQKEIDNLSRIMKNPRRPVTAVLGGSKVSGKIKVINNLMTKVDNIIIGGGMAYSFQKAVGGKIGQSLYEEDMLPIAKEVLEKAKEVNVNIYSSIDTVAADKFSNDARREIYKSTEIPDDMAGMDIGLETCSLYREVILKSATILWNGPMGVFEMDNFSNGTFAIADAIAKATEKGAFSLIGGGDTVSAINKFHLTEKYNYVSTAGGAMLEYCEGKELPGIVAVEE